MPLYTFEHPCGYRVDETFTVNLCPEIIEAPCPGGYIIDDRCKKPACDCDARKVIALGHGGILRDEAQWIDNGLRIALQDTDRIAQGLEAPIETRTDLKRHLKANPHIAID